MPGKGKRPFRVETAGIGHPRGEIPHAHTLDPALPQRARRVQGVEATGAPLEHGGFRRSDGSWDWEREAAAAPVSGRTALSRVAWDLDGGGVRRALVALLPATVAAALAGAVLAGRAYPAAGGPLAALGPAGALAAPAVVTAALLLLHRQVRADAEAEGPSWRLLAARGAGRWQLLALASGPRILLALALAVLVPLAVAPTAAALSLGSGLGRMLLQAWVWALAAGFAAAGVALHAVWDPVLRAQSRAHPRQPRSGWRRTAVDRWHLDLLLLVLAAAVGPAVALDVRRAAEAAAAAYLNGPAFAGGGLPPLAPPPAHVLLGPLAYVGPALFAWASGLVGARLAAAAAAWITRRVRRLPVAVLLPLRAVARDRAASLLLVPAVAAAAAVFAVSGSGAAVATARAAAAMRAGSDLRLQETWPAPCGAACTAQVLQLLPPPDVAGTNRGLPGVRAAAELVPAQDQIQTGSVGTTPATLLGISPGAYAAAVRWPEGFAGEGRRVLALLRGHPAGAVISESLAAATGLRPGDTMQSGILGGVPVLAVLPQWPGVPAATGPWALVRWRTLQPALQQHGAFTGSGFEAIALLRLAPGASLSAITAALAQRGVTAQGAVTGVGPAAPSPLAGVLWPLAVLAAVVFAAGALDRWREEEGRPGEETARAAGAEEAVRRGERWLLPTLAGAGLTWGALAGWAAAALFWRDLQVAVGPLSGPVHTVPLGAWAALAGALLAAAVALRLWPADTPDVEVVARLAPAEATVAAAPAPPVAPSAAPRRRPAQGSLPRAAWAVLVLAARRLRSGWTRVLGLACGLLLAAGVAATVPLYTAGALTRVLQAGLQPYNDRPAGAVLVRWLPTGQGGLGAAAAPTTLSAADAARLASLTASVGRAAALPTTPLVRYQVSADEQVITQAELNNPYASGVYFGGSSIDAMSALGAHVRIVRGRMYRAAPEAGGVIEAVVTQDAFRTDHLQLGQVYLYPSAAPGGGYVRLRLVGVFAERDPTGPFWPYRYFTSDFFVAPSAFARLLAKGEISLGGAAWYTTLDLGRLTAIQVPAAMDGVQRVALAVSGVVPGAAMDVSPYNELASFVQRAETLTGLLRLVSIPVLAIALYFVAITAGLIVAADRAEIAVFSSRGAPAGQLVALYLLEWVLLAVPVTLLGPLPAALFARVVGASRGFLHFAAAPLPVFVRPVDFAYAGVAAALGVVAAMVPVLGSLGRSIVGARARASRTVEQPLWQRAYLDAVALAVLAVIWWGFRHASVQSGGGAAALADDPALFLLPPAFLVVSGLLVVRFLGWLLRTLDAAVGTLVRPAVSLPLRRIGRLPAQFAPVLLLLCFTAALGTYAAASARTLDQNLTAAADYSVGADAQLQEVSPCSLMHPEVGVCLTYDHVPLNAEGVRPMPPFALHAGIPGVQAAAELVEQQVTVNGPFNAGQADLVLIDPSTYGRVAWWMPGLNQRPLSSYLALLTSQPGAALVDPAFAASLGLQVGATFTLSDGSNQGTFTDVGAVSRWPGADANAPLVVADLGYAKSAMGLIPAERTALLRLAPGANLANIENALANRGIFTQSASLASAQASQALGTPEWAGQTGVLTLGFLTALGITILGYLFYAAVLLRGQLNQLGLLFALGLPWGAVLGTVAVEQGTLLVSGAASGAVAGVVAAALFLPLLRPAFTGSNAPPFLTLGPGGALAEVAGVLVVLLAVALASLLVSLRRLRVGDTLKAEE